MKKLLVILGICALSTSYAFASSKIDFNSDKEQFTCGGKDKFILTSSSTEEEITKNCKQIGWNKPTGSDPARITFWSDNHEQIQCTLINSMVGKCYIRK